MPEISNAQLAADIQNVVLGYQTFLEGQFEWLLSEEATVDLTDPYTQQSVTVKTPFQLAAEYDATVGGAGSELAAATQLLADATVLYNNASTYDVTFSGYIVTASNHAIAAGVSEANSLASANASATSASASSTSENNAATSALNASNSESAASGSASSANISSITASDSETASAASELAAAASAALAATEAASINLNQTTTIDGLWTFLKKLEIDITEGLNGGREALHLKNNGGSWITFENTATSKSWYFTHEHEGANAFNLTHTDTGGKAMELSTSGDVVFKGSVTAGTGTSTFDVLEAEEVKPVKLIIPRGDAVIGNPSTGTPGTMYYTDNHLFLCINPNEWTKVPLTSIPII